MFAHPIHGNAQENFICRQGWLVNLSPTLSKIQIRYIQVCQYVSICYAQLLDKQQCRKKFPSKESRPAIMQASAMFKSARSLFLLTGHTASVPYEATTADTHNCSTLPLPLL